LQHKICKDVGSFFSGEEEEEEEEKDDEEEERETREERRDAAHTQTQERGRPVCPVTTLSLGPVCGRGAVPQAPTQYGICKRRGGGCRPIAPVRCRGQDHQSTIAFFASLCLSVSVTISFYILNYQQATIAFFVCFSLSLVHLSHFSPCLFVCLFGRHLLHFVECLQSFLQLLCLFVCFSLSLSLSGSVANSLESFISFTTMGLLFSMAVILSDQRCE
jgi:hypothetical protein